MLKIKPTRLLIYACLLIAFYACTTKNEVPQPVVDTARVDALRTELMALQQKVLGAQQTTSNDSLTLVQLQSEIAKLKAYLTKTVSYTVSVSSFLFTPLSGATVKLSQDGKVVSATTSSGGSATFNNLYAGIVTGTVDLNGFARLVFRADIRNTYDSASAYSTNSQVLMIPLGGTPKADSCMTTQYWKLYANYNAVDDTLGGPQYWGSNSTPTKALPAGPDPNAPTVSYTAVTTQPILVSLNQYSFIDGNIDSDTTHAIPIGFTGWDVYKTGITGNGQVVAVTYENTIWTATAGPNDIYTVKLPASDINNININYNNYSSVDAVNVFAFAVDFGEFTHDFTQYTNGTAPYIVKSAASAIPTYTSTFIYRVMNPSPYDPSDPYDSQWTSMQSTSVTAAWPFFFSGTLK